MTPALEARRVLVDEVARALFLDVHPEFDWDNTRRIERPFWVRQAEAAVTVLIGQTGEVCEPCGGTGKKMPEWGEYPVHGFEEPCKPCGGRGRAPDRPPTRMPCAVCAGTTYLCIEDGEPERGTMPLDCQACGGSGVGELAVLAALGMEQTGWLWTQEGSTAWRQWTLTEPSGHAISKVPVYAAIRESGVTP